MEKRELLSFLLFCLIGLHADVAVFTMLSGLEFISQLILQDEETASHL